MQVLAERAAWDWLKREGGSTEVSVVLPVSARKTGCPSVTWSSIDTSRFCCTSSTHDRSFLSADQRWRCSARADQCSYGLQHNLPWLPPGRLLLTCRTAVHLK